MSGLILAMLSVGKYRDVLLVKFCCCSFIILFSTEA